METTTHKQHKKRKKKKQKYNTQKTKCTGHNYTQTTPIT
jgi:hypothetical protein